MNIESTLHALADLGASWILWVLIALSLGAVTVVVERAFYFRKHRDDTRAIRTKLLRWIATGRVRETVELLRRTRGVEAQVALAAMEATTHGPEAVNHALEGAEARARIGMERGISFLGTVGSNAPFVGLLGTVIGIIRAFRYLDASEGRVSAGLMSEVGEALIATAVGILVALPAVAAFNHFQVLMQRRLTSARALSSELLAGDHLGVQPVVRAAE